MITWHAHVTCEHVTSQAQGHGGGGQGEARPLKPQGGGACVLMRPHAPPAFHRWQVKLVLSNHKMVQESLGRSYGYQRIELWPANINFKFNKARSRDLDACTRSCGVWQAAYEAMTSELYDPASSSPPPP